MGAFARTGITRKEMGMSVSGQPKIQAKEGSGAVHLVPYTEQTLKMPYFHLLFLQGLHIPGM